MNRISMYFLGSSLLLAGCAAKTPYATLSEKVFARADVARRYRLQPLPAPYPYLALGDIIYPTEVPAENGGKTIYLDSFEVVTSPQSDIAEYNHPEIPGISKCILTNFQKDVGSIGSENIVVALDGKTLGSIGGGYKNAAFDAGAKVLHEKSQTVEFDIPLQYQRPAIMNFDRMLAEVQSDSYEPLKKGCSGGPSENNFPDLRKKIKGNLERSKRLIADGKKLNVIDVIVWSDSLKAKIVDGRNTEVSANAKADLAAIATGVIGTPNAEVKYADSDKNSVSVTQARTHWAYRAMPIKIDPTTGLFVVDRAGSPLLLSSQYRKVPKNI